MAAVGLGDWRFEPAAEGGSARDRVHGRSNSTPMPEEKCAASRTR
jgi:hypothetical protein